MKGQIVENHETHEGPAYGDHFRDADGLAVEQLKTPGNLHANKCNQKVEGRQRNTQGEPMVKDDLVDQKIKSSMQSFQNMIYQTAKIEQFRQDNSAKQ